MIYGNVQLRHDNERSLVMLKTIKEPFVKHQQELVTKIFQKTLFTFFNNVKITPFSFFLFVFLLLNLKSILYRYIMND